MASPDNSDLDLRMKMLGIALIEVAKTLPTKDAVRVSNTIRTQFAILVGAVSLSEETDELVAAELAPLLAALELV